MATGLGRLELAACKRSTLRIVNGGAVGVLHFTYLLHAAVLLEKLTGSHLVKKFPTFYGTRKFITAFTRAHHLSLS